MYNVEEHVKWKSIKKYPCKKGKGEHKFELHETIPPYEFLKGCPPLYHYTYIYKCSVCGKKKYGEKPSGYNLKKLIKK